MHTCSNTYVPRTYAYIHTYLHIQGQRTAQCRSAARRAARSGHEASGNSLSREDRGTGMIARYVRLMRMYICTICMNGCVCMYCMFLVFKNNCF